MAKYTRADDGKVVDGKTVVWIEPPASAAPATEGPSASSAAATEERSAAASPEGRAAGRTAQPAARRTAGRAAMAAAQAGALVDAAKKGVPFCEECEAARKRLQDLGEAAA